MATDGNTNTCSRQGKSSTTKNLSWSIRLPFNESINEIQITTNTWSLVYFKNFEVFVGYISISGNDDDVNKQTCFRQGHDIPKTTTFTILCDKPIIGNDVKIELEESQNVLNLCDVRINGGIFIMYYTFSNHSLSLTNLVGKW
ncbi:uncharacterized protein LOC132744435 [Ruditapes philippinarum]|uniref:uncharacterized protein LOC132744435 n=1 Tax=Ruditapes philippinarum TaxID=129788 RepID=UPI00295B8993|nr:uncharacterized protein LOC132744435 [Ruditapes philippinarum]